jgi:hypothetical protein
MRLPLPFLLYVTALGLFSWAGWTVYSNWSLWKLETRNQASLGGRNESDKLIKKGRGVGAQAKGVNYAAPNWWEQFKQVNLIGKLPERAPTAAEMAAAKEAEEPKVDLTPLEEIFELVSLVYDGAAVGKGGDTHVIIRYKAPDVAPPEWWVKENTAPASGARRSGPRDLAAAPSTARTRRGRGASRPSQPTPMPTSTMGRQDILQKIWVDDGGDPRRAANLWAPYGHLRLVRVAGDAQSAFFVRQEPVVEGQPAAEPKEEELLKTTADIPQDVLAALRKLQGRGPSREPSGVKPRAATNQWRDVEETTRVGNQFHIGRKDEQRFRSTDDFFGSVYVDTYVSKTSNLRGVSVRSVAPKVASSYGVETGDVLLKINGRKISSKAQATNMVKKDYQRGVRTFATEWLSNGQVVERVYQAPDK